MSRLLLPWGDVGPGISPYDGALLYVYEPNTSTLTTTYSDPELTIENDNPVEADEDGVFPDMFIGTAVDVVLKDKNDVQIRSATYVEGAIESPTEVINYYAWENVAAEANLPAATSYTLTGIDSSAIFVDIEIKGLSLSGNNGLAVRVGNGSIITSGYTGESRASTESGSQLEQQNWGGTLDSLSANTYGGLFTNLTTNTNKIDGVVQLYKSITGFWGIRFLLTEYNTNEDSVKTYWGGGRVAVSGNLDRIQLLSGNADTFDSGTVIVKQYANTGTLLASGNSESLAEYGNNGSFYENTGTSDDMIFTIPSDAVNRDEYPPLNGSVYLDGTEVVFFATGNNTGATTGQLNTTGPIIDIVLPDNSATPAGTFVEDYAYRLVYSAALDAFVYSDALIIPNDFITNAMMADDSVDTPQLVDESVTTPKLADASVTAAKLASGIGAYVLFNNSSELTSGTSHEVTAIPTCNRIDIFLRDVSLNNSDQIVLQLGHGATPTYITSGYTGKTTRGSGPLAWSTFAYLSNNLSAGNSCGCHIVLQKQQSNIWTINMVGIEPTGAGELRAGFGWVDVTATLTAVKIMSESSGTFDGGYITLTYF